MNPGNLILVSWGAACALGSVLGCALAGGEAEASERDLYDPSIHLIERQVRVSCDRGLRFSPTRERIADGVMSQIDAHQEEVNRKIAGLQRFLKSPEASTRDILGQALDRARADYKLRTIEYQDSQFGAKYKTAHVDRYREALRRSRDHLAALEQGVLEAGEDVLLQQTQKRVEKAIADLNDLAEVNDRFTDLRKVAFDCGRAAIGRPGKSFSKYVDNPNELGLKMPAGFNEPVYDSTYDSSTPQSQGGGGNGAGASGR